MKTLAMLAGGIMLTALMALAVAAEAGTFVYVSNAEDGNIGTYTLLPDGSLQAGARVGAGETGDADERQPRPAFSLRRGTLEALHGHHVRHRPEHGRPEQAVDAPLAESFPYIYSGQDGQLPARRVLWRPPRQRQRDREGRQRGPIPCR